jgi:hypothetical protein
MRLFPKYVSYIRYNVNALSIIAVAGYFAYKYLLLIRNVQEFNLIGVVQQVPTKNIFSMQGLVGELGMPVIILVSVSVITWAIETVAFNKKMPR